MDEMSAREINRLIEWLKAQGYSDEKVVECIRFITAAKE